MSRKPKPNRSPSQPSSGWSRRSALTAGATVVLLGLTLATCHLAPSGSSGPPTSTLTTDSVFVGTSSAGLPLVNVVIAGEPYQLEAAIKPADRRQGLSDRKQIASDGGMLFVFARPASQTFVMRRCLVPIDLIFLNAAGKVINTHAMEVEPYDQPEWQLQRYASDGPAQFAIELSGGSIQRLGLEPGMAIDLPRQALIAAAR